MVVGHQEAVGGDEKARAGTCRLEDTLNALVVHHRCHCGGILLVHLSRGQPLLRRRRQVGAVAFQGLIQLLLQSLHLLPVGPVQQVHLVLPVLRNHKGGQTAAAGSHHRRQNHHRRSFSQLLEPFFDFSFFLGGFCRGFFRLCLGFFRRGHLRLLPGRFRRYGPGFPFLRYRKGAVHFHLVHICKSSLFSPIYPIIPAANPIVKKKVCRFGWPGFPAVDTAPPR